MVENGRSQKRMKEMGIGVLKLAGSAQERGAWGLVVSVLFHFCGVSSSFFWGFKKITRLGTCATEPNTLMASTTTLLHHPKVVLSLCE